MKAIPASDNTVLLLIEFQRQWTAPGLLHWLIRRRLHKDDVIANAARAATHARALGIPVIQAPLIIDPAHKRGLYAWLTAGLFFRKGSPLAELDARVATDTDLQVQGRIAFDAFVGSDLHVLLQDGGRRQLLMAGFATDQCVASTARTARRLGFETWLLGDASATFAPFLQRHAERSFSGNVLSVAEWMHASPARHDTPLKMPASSTVAA